MSHLFLCAGGKALIFVRTRNAADELAALIFQEFGQRSGAIHGMRRQEQREAALEQFRRGYLRALVTTDVLGRGAFRLKAASQAGVRPAGAQQKMRKGRT